MRPSLNWLLVFVPVAVVLEHASAVPAPLVFFSAALAIVPIASLIVRATAKGEITRRAREQLPEGVVGRDDNIEPVGRYSLRPIRERVIVERIRK